MAQNYDLTNTGPEVQERLDQVMPNKTDIAQEVQDRIDGDAAVTTHCEQYTDAETQRAQVVETDLQRQINEIVSGDTQVNLTASPTAVFADGEEKDVTLTTTSSPTPADVTIDGVGSATNITSKTFAVTVNSTTQTTQTYTATFTVAGVMKGEKTATVSLVYPIFYGSGATLASATMTQFPTAKASPAGTYNVTIGAGDHIYFEVPAGMSISRVQLYDNPNFPTDVQMQTVSTERTGADGSAYMAYESVSTFAAGTHAFRVS